ncbi:MAG: sensor histidine kinase KdpD [Cryobacterium sp.]|nr:sensor histidine kinase KdpD [Oligoflexia bacterium]
MRDTNRPDPDALIAVMKKEQEKTNRGKLKVFFGMCPGVGKTYAMLRAAAEKQNPEFKVLLGLIETHQRAETEKLVSGLELLPRKKFEYKGTVCEEFDLDSALERKPDLILVDELAHTNAPGSRHPKRYQDIQDLLFAGINVYTTMNVQHVESRADLVYQISGVPVRETVPDAFLEFADEIVLIDLSPEDLLKRLKDGKVYLGERAERAADNFFKEEKLTALRELALRFTAEIVDDQLRDQMQAKRILGPWNTNERLMVAISHSPSSARLIRATRRKAYGLEAPWVALYVDNGNELGAADHEMLTRNLNLARELGAEVVTTKDRSVADALHRVAGEKNVTQILMGRPDRRFFRDIFGGGNILDRIVNETSEVDIHVVRQKRKPIYRGFHLKLPNLNSGPRIYLRTLFYIAVFVALSYPLRVYLGYRAVGFGLLLAILPISTLAGLGPTLFGAFLTALAWDFLFIPPQFTFAVKETEDAMMILAYFAVASVAGFLASRIKRQEKDLRVRERRANLLYEFGRELAETESDADIHSLGAKSIEFAFPCAVKILRTDSDETLIREPSYPVGSTLAEKDYAVASWACSNEKKAGWKTDTLSSSPCLCLPLRGRSKVMGIIALYPTNDRSLTIDQENLIETISAQLATALEREALEMTSRKTEVYEKSEILHQALLNTVSHELRTPLTAIIGGAGALKDPHALENPELRQSLLDDLVYSAERLNRTVENLMDMSRIASGVLKLNDEVFELNDFIRSLHSRLSKILSSHSLRLELTDEDLFVKGDEKILEHIFQNLVTNAAQYSPKKTTITISTRSNHSYAEFSVKDEGPGIPEHELEKLFSRFYRVPGSPPGGVGLGLSISKAILEAHGGAIFAANRTDRSGSIFSGILPIQQVPREVFE